MKRLKYLLSVLSVLLIFSACQHKEKEPQEVKDSVSIGKTPEQAKMIIARVYVNPEKIQAFIDAAKAMVTQSNTEPGCEFYQLYQDPYDNTKFTFVERYVNQAAVDAHFATDYFKAFGPAIGTWVSKPSEIEIIGICGEEKKVN